MTRVCVCVCAASTHGARTSVTPVDDTTHGISANDQDMAGHARAHVLRGSYEP